LAAVLQNKVTVDAARQIPAMLEGLSKYETTPAGA